MRGIFARLEDVAFAARSDVLCSVPHHARFRVAAAHALGVHVPHLSLLPGLGSYSLLSLPGGRAVRRSDAGFDSSGRGDCDVTWSLGLRACLHIGFFFLRFFYLVVVRLMLLVFMSLISHSYLVSAHAI